MSVSRQLPWTQPDSATAVALAPRQFHKACVRLDESDARYSAYRKLPCRAAVAVSRSDVVTYCTGGYHAVIASSLLQCATDASATPAWRISSL
ncbi:hypothetical protein Q4I28_003228 [Leishmania naiffi]|uniref:Uncharacterized protein n=1 Tax=Leishmania naiffi TaxID=5678 RepID=A0AAW3BV31_9TRYP